MKKLLTIIAAASVLGTNFLWAQEYTDEFGVKAFYVDCRTEVMTMDALNALAEDLSTKGINAIVMEWEATFLFDKHATLCNRYAFTREEVKNFVARCAALGIDVIPLQNCFGHSEYILRHDRYRALREDSKEISQVCPLKIPEATRVFTEIFREVAELHPSQYFHIGADETYLLGSCRECAKVAAGEGGKSKLFVDYIEAMSEIVVEMGKTPVIWADIILENPHAVHELPEELILVDWNYGWEPNRFGDLDNLFKAGVKMWGAPAMRSAPDNLYLTQWEKHFNNLASFVPFARECGYTGMIQTSWSTGGTYGFHYDMSHEILGMYPVRYVYPSSGFNILQDAYCHAVNSAEPLEPKKYVERYARENYGLTADEAAVLWDYFTMPQEIITIYGESKDAKGMPLDEVLEKCVAMKSRLSSLSPKNNRGDFDHYHLMLDLRVNYLQFKQVEALYESPAYDRSQAPALAKRMKYIVADAEKLDKRFTKLNKGYLKDGELAYLNDMRKEKMLTLYGWLLNNQ